MVASYASVEDYEARYGEVEDRDRVETLLSDATAFIDSQPGFSLVPSDYTQAVNLTRVCCSVVHRALVAGDLSGFSQVSEGAVGYTASATVYNPGEDFYLTRADRRSLGIGVGRVGQTWPYDAPMEGEVRCR